MLGAVSYDPIVRIELGPLSISPHGLGIAIGFLVGAKFMLPRSQAKGIPDDVVYPLFTRAAIGAIIGARVAYVLNHFSEYKSGFDALQVWKGGISLIGGFFGAILLALPKLRSSRLSLWKIMDAAAPGMALGVLVGRVGDLIVGDHLGKTTTFFLGYKCPPIGVETASPCTPGTIVHQTALYDMFFAAGLLAVILLFEKRHTKRFEGFLIMVFGAGYGVSRMIEDFLREDLRRFGLTGSQWVALTTLTVCLVNMLIVRRTPKWGHWDERPPPPSTEPTLDGAPDVAAAAEEDAEETS